MPTTRALRKRERSGLKLDALSKKEPKRRKVNMIWHLCAVFLDLDLDLDSQWTRQFFRVAQLALSWPGRGYPYLGRRGYLSWLGEGGRLSCLGERGLLCTGVGHLPYTPLWTDRHLWKHHLPAVLRRWAAMMSYEILIYYAVLSSTCKRDRLQNHQVT